jgi:large subunit ribosomal protein L10
MSRAEKELVLTGIKDRFSKMTSAVFVDFSGMTVEEVSNLRGRFRARGVEYKVLKNTMVKKALEGEAFAPSLSKALRGMTGVAWSYEEPSAAARVVKDFVKENEKLKIKAGLLEGQVLTGKQVEDQLAALPSKDEARSMLLATFNAPAQTFVRLINAPGQNFVLLMEAKRNKDAG